MDLSTGNRSARSHVVGCSWDGPCGFSRRLWTAGGGNVKTFAVKRPRRRVDGGGGGAFARSSVCSIPATPPPPSTVSRIRAYARRRGACHIARPLPAAPDDVAGSRFETLSSVAREKKIYYFPGVLSAGRVNGRQPPHHRGKTVRSPGNGRAATYTGTGRVRATPQRRTASAATVCVSVFRRARVGVLFRARVRCAYYKHERAVSCAGADDR